jgi:hypothetical protein
MTGRDSASQDEPRMEPCTPEPPLDASTDAWLGHRIEAHRLADRIGPGGMGMVYKTVLHDLVNERTVHA